METYQRLQRDEIKVILVAYAHYRAIEDRIRVQFADKIAICNIYAPKKRGINIGSGTIVANANFLSFEPFIDFFLNILILKNRPLRI